MSCRPTRKDILTNGCKGLDECPIYVYNGSCGEKAVEWFVRTDIGIVMGCCADHATAILSQGWQPITREEAETLQLHAE